VAFFTISVLSSEENFVVVTGSSRIEVSLDDALPRLSQAQLKHWIQNAADAVVAYYGRFPVPRATLRIRAFDGSGVRGGQTFPMHGGFIRIAVGRETTPDDLDSDWMLTHEMVHLTFPSMSDEHHWIEEGIATYVEPIARVQAKQFDAPRMWLEVVRDLPKGLPQDGDQGLDHTHTWGRTYWGGALFCFLADLEIRKQTHNQKGLQDALRGILNSGGDMREDWELTKALEIGDRSIGVDVLLPLYRRMKDKSDDKSDSMKLDSIWSQLGISSENGTVKFIDDAPLAAIRKSITAARK
jgi:hypothetical protein